MKHKEGDDLSLTLKSIMNGVCTPKHLLMLKNVKLREDEPARKLFTLLVGVAVSPNARVQIRALAVLKLFTYMESNCYYIAETEAVEPIINLIAERDCAPQVQQKAINFITRISQSEFAFFKIMECGIRGMAALLRSKYITIQTIAGDRLLEMARNEDTCEHLVDSNSLAVLFVMCKSKQANIQEYVTKALTFIAQRVQYIDCLIDNKAVEVLFEILETTISISAQQNILQIFDYISQTDRGLAILRGHDITRLFAPLTRLPKLRRLTINALKRLSPGATDTQEKIVKDAEAKLQKATGISDFSVSVNWEKIFEEQEENKYKALDTLSMKKMWTNLSGAFEDICENKQQKLNLIMLFKSVLVLSVSNGVSLDTDKNGSFVYNVSYDGEYFTRAAIHKKLEQLIAKRVQKMSQLILTKKNSEKMLRSNTFSSAATASQKIFSTESVGGSAWSGKARKSHAVVKNGQEDDDVLGAVLYESEGDSDDSDLEDGFKRLAQNDDDPLEALKKLAKAAYKRGVERFSNYLNANQLHSFWKPNEQESYAITCCSKAYVGPEELLIKGWHVIKLNKMSMQQERVLLLTNKNYYTVKYDFQRNEIDGKHCKVHPLKDFVLADIGPLIDSNTAISKIPNFGEDLPKGLKIFTREPPHLTNILKKIIDDADVAMVDGSQGEDDKEVAEALAFKRGLAPPRRRPATVGMYSSVFIPPANLTKDLETAFLVEICWSFIAAASSELRKGLEDPYVMEYYVTKPAHGLVSRIYNSAKMGMTSKFGEDDYI